VQLQEACVFLERLSGVRVFSGRDPETLARFCAESRFHRVQLHLFPAELIKLLDTVEENELVSVEDELQIRLQLGCVGGENFVFGPYCSENLSTLDARALLLRCAIPEGEAKALLAYRSRFPVISEQRAQRMARSLLLQLSGCDLLPPVRRMDFLRPVPAQASHVEQPYADIISERYAIEQEMMQAVRAGNAAHVTKCWRQLHLRMDYLKKQVGYSLQGAITSSTGTRTVLRLAAMEAGVPPVILDDLTGRIAQKNREARSLDEIEHNTETLILDLCRAVRTHKRGETDYLTESVRFYIDAHYSDELTVADLAEHFDVAEARLIQIFRVRMGVTPGLYLRQVRMRRAAELLRGTRNRVQEIAAEVGVPDANYFIKQFRAEYGKTPSAYRKEGG
jgi:AraC-like DNA-binding protein